MWRRTFILMAMFAGAALGMGLALKSERVARGFVARLEQLAESALGVEAHIGALHIALLPPAMLVEDVTFKLPEQSAAFLSLRRAKASLYPWPTPSGTWVADRVEADGVEADLDLDALTPVFARLTGKKASSALGLPIDIRHLLLWNVRLAAHRGDWRVSLARTDLSVLPADFGVREVELSVGEGSVVSPAGKLGFEVRVRGLLEGTLAAPRVVTLQRTSLFADEVALDGQGSVQLAPPYALDVAVSGRAALANLQRLLQRAVVATGDSRFSGRLRGTLEHPSLRTTLALRGARYARLALGDVDIESVLDPTRLQVEAFDWKQPHFGQVTGSGALALTSGLPVTIKARLHQVSLQSLVEFGGLAGPWVTATLNGDVEARGALVPLHLDLRMLAGTAEQFTVFDRSYLDPERAVMLAPGPIAILGEGTVTEAGVAITEAELSSDETDFIVSGTAAFDPEVGVTLHVASDRFDFDDIGKVAGAEFAGAGTLAGVVEGPYRALTISCTAAIDDLSILGYPVADTKATIVYEDLVFRVERATGRRGGGTMSGAASIDFNIRPPIFDAAFVLENIELGDALNTAGIHVDVLHHAHARLSGDISAHGPLGAPLGRVSLASPMLSLGDTPIGPLEYEGGFFETENRFWSKGHVHAPGGVWQGSYTLNNARRVRIDTSLEHVPLAAISPLIPGLDVQGDLSASVALAGEAGALVGKVRARIPDYVAYGTHLGGTELVGDVADGHMRFVGTLLEGTVNAEGDLGLSSAFPYTLAARFRQTAVGVLWPSIADIDAAAGGSLTSSGLLADAATIDAHIDLVTGKYRLWGVNFELARPVELHYLTRQITIVAPAVVSGTGISGTVAGVTDVDGHAMQLEIVGTADLDAARFAVPQVQFSHGKATLHLVYTGSWQVPQIAGEVTLVDGLARVGDFGQLVEQLNGRAVFAGRTLELESATAVTGGGTLRLGGQALFSSPRASSRLNLRADLNGVSLRPTGQLQLTTTGHLALTGETRDLLLSGDLKLDTLRYTANLDLERLIPKRQAPPLRVAPADASHVVRLGVHVSAADNIYLTSNVVEAELAAELMFTGTTERIGLVGSVSPRWAKARYQDNDFTVERASILFTDEYRVSTEFDVRAKTLACGAQITVDIKGNSDGYNVQPTGTDEFGPVAPQDVLACLQFGVRMGDVRRELATRGNSSLPMNSLDALWAVSGLDEQVRRVLPMVDELRLSSGWSPVAKRTTPRLVLGKELGKDLRLSYSRGLEEQDDQLLNVEYRLNELATLEGTWNRATEAQLDVGVDLRLRWEFQ